LRVIEDFRHRKISLWLLDLGNDCTGNGISQLITTILGAVAEFERTLISERIKDAKANLRRSGRHQGGFRPFGFRLGQANGHGRAREPLEDLVEQKAITEMRRVREAGATLRAIAGEMKTRGFPLSPETVRQVLTRDAKL